MSKLTKKELAILNAKPSELPDKAKIKWPKIKKWKRRKTRTTLEPSRPHPGTKRAREIIASVNKPVNICESCGVKGTKHHVHHKDRNPYDNDLSNLMVLCSHCHAYIHDVDGAIQDIKEEDYALGIIEDESF